MQLGTNQGRQDWILVFYSPSKSKNAILEKTTTLTTTSRKIKAERVFKSSAERMEATQQVGNTTLSFRMADIRKGGSGLAITYEWEFDAYPISNVSLSKRFRVEGIEDEGRRNFIVVTGVNKDNG